MKRQQLLALVCMSVFPLFACAEADKPDTPKFETLKCLGTEPFWSVDQVNGKVVYSDIDDNATTFNLVKVTRSANHTNRWILRGVAENSGEVGLALTKTQQCSDDMSDFSYDFEVIVSLPGDQVLSGCCNRR